MNEQQIKEMLELKDIIKNGNEFELVNSCHKTNEGALHFNHSIKESHEHTCDFCSHYIQLSDFDGECEVLYDLLNHDSDNIIYSSLVHYCEAYDRIENLNIINSKEEMIEFIKRTENCFSCPEYHERYYGFNRNWNEETGEILETIDEYAKRNGEFRNIPKEYPCVIYFNFDIWRPLDYIYIGGNKQ